MASLSFMLQDNKIHIDNSKLPDSQLAMEERDQLKYSIEWTWTVV